jgi:hypothetical protein
VWWHWVVGGVIVQLVVGAFGALLLGRTIRLADERSPGSRMTGTAAERGAFIDRRPVGTSPRRRAVPLPPVGIALAATAVSLETCALVLHLTGATGPTARLLSMDAPFALPRVFVALLFAAAAIAAVGAAARLPSRRTWWLAVAAVAGGITIIKADGNVQADALRALEAALGGTGAVLVGVLAAGAVLGGLWFLTRTERRDRRRVLGSLFFFAFASVCLEPIFGGVPVGFAATTTYVEECAEALAAVAFLMAVLGGVAPRLVLPASWALRRAADAHALEVAPARRVRPAEGASRS